MRKKYFLLLTLCCIFLTSCSIKKNTKDTVIETNTDTKVQEKLAPYIYTKESFIEAYEKAVLQLENGELPKEDAPVTPDESGFSILPLDEAVYGIPAFAVLPLMERPLTGEEMLQLANAFPQISPDDLLSAPYVWMDGKETNPCRGYTFRENFLSIKLTAAYLYEGVRPASPLSNDPKDKNAICVTITKRTKPLKYYIYPAAEMTEDQILQIIEETYKDIPEAYYQPEEDEMQYHQIKEQTESLVKYYAISEEPIDFTIANFLSERGSSSPLKREPQWQVMVSAQDQTDYILILSPQGDLLNWQRYPYHFLTETQPPENARENADSYETEPLEEDVKEAAASYMEQIKKKDQKRNELEVDSSISASDSKYSVVKVTLSDQTQYSIQIAKKDLSIRGLEIIR